MRITDGKQTIEVSIKFWNGEGYTPDNAEDILIDSSYKYNADIEAWEVPNVEDVIAFCEEYGNYEDEATYNADEADIEAEKVNYGERVVCIDHIDIS